MMAHFESGATLVVMCEPDPPTTVVQETLPQRVPIKIIGRDGVLDHAAITSIILGQLGEQDRTDWHSNRKGAYVSHTFWVVLPNEHAEEPLRRAIHTLPGVIMQL